MLSSGIWDVNIYCLVLVIQDDTTKGFFDIRVLKWFGWAIGMLGNIWEYHIVIYDWNTWIMIYIVCKVPKSHLFSECLSFIVFLVMVLQVGEISNRTTRELTGQLGTLHEEDILVILSYRHYYIFMDLHLCYALLSYGFQTPWYLWMIYYGLFMIYMLIIKCVYTFLHNTCWNEF